MRAKVAFEERRCMELEKVVNNPKNWWKLAQKMKVVNRRGDKVDVTKVYDKDRNLKTGSEKATGVDTISDHGGSLDEDFTREEIRWALRGQKSQNRK